MPGSWIPNIAFIQDGVDKVTAQDTNRPLAQLDQRTQYLKDMLQALSSGELLVANNVTLDSTTIPGTPVYFDDTTNTFRPGLAAVDIAAGNNYGFATDTSLVRGVVLAKYGSTAGDVALVGRISNAIWGINWALVIDTGALTAGIFYLSSVTAGKISKSRGSLSVHLGSMNSSGDLILNPVINGSLRDHLHYRFELNATLVPNTTTEGWAPISEFSTYPVGALYGYVIAQNAELAAAFPPIPVDAFYLEYQGRGVHQDTIVLDANGLWWMDTPLPNALTGDPDFPTPKYFALWITRLNFGAAFVSTLDGQDDDTTIPVVFLDPNGNPGDSGVLTAGITSSVKAQPGLDEGALALKTLTGVKAYWGPIISRVFAGAGVAIEGEFGDDSAGWYGGITITAGASSEVIGDPVLVALDNAREDFYGNLPVLSLPELRTSSVRSKVNVPTNLQVNRSMKLVVDVIGVAAGAITLNLTYVIVRVGQAINQTEIPLTPLAITRIANQVTRVVSDLIPVLPGDTVYYRVTQPNAGLATAVPILRMQYSIVRTP